MGAIESAGAAGMLRQAGEEHRFTITCRSDPSRVARCSGPANSRYAQKMDADSTLIWAR